MGDKKWCPQHGYPLPCDKCGMPLTPLQQKEIYKAGMRKVVEFINDLIIGIDGCKFEERLDGDKGCIVLDMCENQWQAKLKEWGLR